jgi:hypothetical protein
MKQTAVEWLHTKLSTCTSEELVGNVNNWFEQAKEMEKEQIGYTKEDVLKAGEMGEINHHDTKHIVSYLDEAKHYNETFN